MAAVVVELGRPSASGQDRGHVGVLGVAGQSYQATKISTSGSWSGPRRRRKEELMFMLLTQGLRDACLSGTTRASLCVCVCVEPVSWLTIAGVWSTTTPPISGRIKTRK